MNASAARNKRLSRSAKVTTFIAMALFLLSLPSAAQEIAQLGLADADPSPGNGVLDMAACPGTTALGSLLVQSTGTTYLVIESIYTSGGSQFTAAPCDLPIMLAPGASQTIEVYFEAPPSGSADGTLHIISNDGVQPAVEFSLHGEATHVCWQGPGLRRFTTKAPGWTELTLTVTGFLIAGWPTVLAGCSPTRDIQTIRQLSAPFARTG